jgi:selenide,water dikinase
VGDRLLLTKPIGVGILSTAQKRGALQEGQEELLYRHLGVLNKSGEVLGAIPGVHAMTDVTGFGLLGHLIEMAEGSNCGATLHYSTIPVIQDALVFLKDRLVPDATYRNWNAYQSKVSFAPGVNVMEAFSLLPDPQTNGGLLLAVSPESLSHVQQVLEGEGLGAHCIPIGEITTGGEKTIQVLP